MLSASLILAQGSQLLLCLASHGKDPSHCTTLSTDCTTETRGMSIVRQEAEATKEVWLLGLLFVVSVCLASLRNPQAQPAEHTYRVDYSLVYCRIDDQHDIVITLVTLAGTEYHTVSDIEVFGCEADLSSQDTQLPPSECFHTVLLKSQVWAIPLSRVYQPC